MLFSSVSPSQLTPSSRPLLANDPRPPLSRLPQIDLVSVFPIFIFEMDSEGDPDIGKLKVMRTIRLLRLMKLARMLRASRIFKAWEAELLAYNFALISLLKFVILIFLVGHWLACAWGLVGVMSGKATSWVGAHGFLDAPPEELYVQRCREETKKR